MQILLYAFLVLSSVIAHAEDQRDLILQISIVDFYPDQVSAAGAARRQRDLIRRFPEYRVESIVVSWPSDPNDWNKHEYTRSPKALEVQRQLSKILATTGANVRLLILDTPSGGDYLPPMGYLRDYQPDEEYPTLRHILAPLEGRLAPDAGVVSLGTSFDADRPEMVTSAVHMLNRFGAKQGSFFTLTTPRSPLPDAALKTPGDGAFIAASVAGLSLAMLASGRPDFFAAARAAIAAAGVWAAYRFYTPLSAWKTFKYVPSGYRTVPWRTISGKAALTIAGALVAASAGDLHFALRSVLYGGLGYSALALIGNIRDHLLRRSMIKAGELDVGRRISIDGDKIVATETLRLNGDHDRIFDCAKTLVGR